MLVLAGLTIIAYAGAVIVEAIAGGVFTGVLAERRRERTIERLNDHFIICGYGRVGRRVAEEFRAAGVAVRRARLPRGGGRRREGARRPADRGQRDRGRGSRAAGHRARRGLVVASDDDADNLYISLSARHVRPDIQIVARASDEDAEKKLLLAGADRVVMPYTAAGRTMANLVLKPQVMSFLDAVTTATAPTCTWRRSRCDATCAQRGKTIRDIRVRHETGAIIVALRKRDGTFDTTPEPDAVIEAGDVSSASARPTSCRRLEDLFARGEAVGA